MSEVSEDGPVWSGWDAFAQDFARQVGVAEDSEAPVKKVFQDSVDVVYAESPSNFYVRFLRHRDKLYLIYYTVHVREWRHLESPDIRLQTERNDDEDGGSDSDWTDDEEESGGGRLKVGLWVLARLRQLGPKRPPFQRAQIKQLNFSPDSGVLDGVLVEFLDWGIVSWLDPGGIRFLPPFLLTVPRLAKQCTLNRIYPLPDDDTGGEEDKDEEEEDNFDYDDDWSEAAKAAFVDLIYGGDLTLEMIHDTVCMGAGPAEVDLLLYKDGNPSSVRDLLVFEDHGCLADPKTFAQDTDESSNDGGHLLGADGPHISDIQTLSLETGSWVLVRITCVRSPAEVHVQPVKMVGGGGSLWADMQSRMDLFYANRDVQYRYQVDEAVEGMVCAVRVPGPSLDDLASFRRCRIEQVVPHTRLAQVVMPDTGHRLVVGTRDLFILSQDDFVRPCPYALSLPVSISNIKPIIPSLGWGGEATRHIRAFIGHTLAMHVCPDEVAASSQELTHPDPPPPYSGLPSVALFYADGGRFVCMNTQLVEQNLCLAASEVSAQDSASVSDENDSSSDQDTCPILDMLAGCARNECRHPLAFDDTVLEWMLQEWRDD